MVIISRTDPQFLMRLFEIEIPEIYDGIIEIKRIAREPGDRAKVAVLSHDERIDAVGACVGMKGVRIHAIVRELNNENIDVVNYTEDPIQFIQRALAPAKLKDIQIDQENNKVNITVATDQVSLAIGKGGQNVRLASKLTGYEILVQKEGGEEEEYDMDLSEFREELGDVLFHRFFDENFHTVRDVLQASKEDIMNTLAIDSEKVDEIIAMLRKGLEDAEVENDDDANEMIAELNASIDAKKEEAAGDSAVSETPAPAAESKEKTEESAS
jgi:N utilization substance protein A